MIEGETPLLRVSGLKKTFGKNLFGRGGFRALVGVDLEVSAGSVFGLLGPNGAGKTTLVKILLGLIRGWEGEAEIFGKPVGEASARQRVGFLPEAHRMPGYLTGRQVVQLFGMMTGGNAGDMRRRTPELLDLVGLTSFEDKKVRTYSKGMQQRLGLAQALVNRPDLIFLDEPTDGIDPIGRKKIREIVQDLKDKGVTIFINSHLLMEVEMICDRVVIMHKGQVLREGTTEDLTAHTGSVRVQLERVPENLSELLDGVGSGLRADERGFDLVADTRQLNQAIDRLRAAGTNLLEVEQRKLTLEEAFIDLVRRKEA